MQKNSHDFKLPQIRKTHKESAKTLSKTSGDSLSAIRARPSSSTKVQDLQKQLFSKLESYQGTSKKHIIKKAGKSSKLIDHECSTGTQSTPQSYEKMQQMMPGLYGKLVEVKKGNFVTGNKIKNQLQEAETIGKKNQEASKRKNQSKNTYVTSFSQQKYQQETQQNLLISQVEMQNIFDQYLKTEGLTGNTSSKQMKQLSSSILMCEKGIQELTNQMSKMVEQLSLQCLSIDDNCQI